MWTSVGVCMFLASVIANALHHAEFPRYDMAVAMHFQGPGSPIPAQPKAETLIAQKSPSNPH